MDSAVGLMDVSGTKQLNKFQCVMWMKSLLATSASKLHMRKVVVSTLFSANRAVLYLVSMAYALEYMRITEVITPLFDD